tara:strand:+ start:267 stop:878 length:612 start_codon:yes stop_codon:yes gene_type:complete
MSNFIHGIMMNDTSLCDDLLDYYNKSNEYKQKGYSVGVGDKKSTDVAVYPNSKDTVIQAYYVFLGQALKSYKEIYDTFSSNSVAFGEPFNIQHYEPGEGFLNWHCERSVNQTQQRALVFMTYLNDVTDGGETEWKYQEVKLQPKKGMTVLWPTDFTHTHRGIVSPTQSKTIATGWFNYIDVVGASEHYENIINQMKEKVAVKS